SDNVYRFYPEGSCFIVFFFSSRRRHTRFSRDWSSDVCSSDLLPVIRRFTAARRDKVSRPNQRLQPLTFGLVPQAVQLLQIGLGEHLAVLPQPGLDEAQAPLELLVATAQGGFRVHLEVAGQVDHGKQQVADLLANLLLITPTDGFAYFLQLFTDLVDN